MTWRTGRKVGRTIYAQVGTEPSDADNLIGVMDTSELARAVVAAVNKGVGEQECPTAGCGHLRRGHSMGGCADWDCVCTRAYMDFPK